MIYDIIYCIQSSKKNYVFLFIDLSNLKKMKKRESNHNQLIFQIQNENRKPTWRSKWHVASFKNRSNALIL